MTLPRRSFLSLLAAAAGGAVPESAHAGGFIYTTSRNMSRTMAEKYKLNGDGDLFNELFGAQNAFRGLKAFPQRDSVIYEGVRSLQKVLAGRYVNKRGYRRVVRKSEQKLVVFSDHHILPSGHRQAAVWRANRGPYVDLLRHYGDRGYLVVENGDVEDLVITEPRNTVKAYREIYQALGDSSENPVTLLRWFREDPIVLEQVMRDKRGKYRREQLFSILRDQANRPYYDTLLELTRSKQLLRIAGNHDYQLQEFDGVYEHLVPADILVVGTQRPTVIMHGHQFDSATNPTVAPFYGEVISECLGVFYQGPDRYWTPREGEKMISAGFPNRLSTHHPHSSAVSSFMNAMLSETERGDEEWAAAWEALFGHPIAWEYGAANWRASVRSGMARPNRMIRNAMSGEQFFKYRHLDEWDLVRTLQQWGLQIRLSLGHSHEIRDWNFSEGGLCYCNSGAVGRFARLIWALEIENDQVTVVGWYAKDRVEKYRFEVREMDMFSYFEPIKTGEKV